MGRASFAGAPPPKEMMSGLVIAPNRLLTTLAVYAIAPIRFAYLIITLAPPYSIAGCCRSNMVNAIIA